MFEISASKDECNLRDSVIFEDLVVNPDNYSHKIKGLSDFISISRPNKNPLETHNVSDYYKNISDDLLSLLPVKERYAFNNIKFHYAQQKNVHQPQLPIDSNAKFISDHVATISVNWASIIYLKIPGIKDDFPILLNYYMRVPDCYPYLPTGELDQIFESLTVGSSISAYLDYVEMADYNAADLPDIVYFNEFSERKVISGNSTAQTYFSAVNNLYIQDICKVLTSGQSNTNTVYRHTVFDILRDHIKQSFKTCMIALLKRSAPLVIPGDHLYVLLSGKTHQRRKFKYEDIQGELKNFGYGVIQNETKKECISIEWVTYCTNEQPHLKYLKRPVVERCNYAAHVTEHPYVLGVN